jgi:hypothetical protein
MSVRMRASSPAMWNILLTMVVACAAAAAPTKPASADKDDAKPTKRSVTMLPLVARGELSQKAAKGVTSRIRDAVGGVEGILPLEASKEDDRAIRQCSKAADTLEDTFDVECLRDAMFVRQATRLGAGIVTPVDGALLVQVLVIERDGSGILKVVEARITDDAAPAPVDRLAREMFAEETLRGSLMVEGNEGDAVFVDGQPRGALPLQLDGLREGTHELVVRRAGYSDFMRQVDIRHAETVELTAVLIPGDSRADVASVANDEGTLPVAQWIMMGSGVALIGVGVGAGVISMLEAQNLEELARQQKLFLPQSQDALNRGAIAAIAANALYVVGGAALVGGAAWWLLSAAADDAEAAPIDRGAL